MADDTLAWLLGCDEPWTRYRTLVDLLDRPENDDEVRAARVELLTHPRVKELIAATATWGALPLKRHNDAAHPLHAFKVLADFGLRAGDAGVAAGLAQVLAHRDPQGAFLTLVNVPTAFGGTGQDVWAWMPCDAPLLLHALAALGAEDSSAMQGARRHLLGLVGENGWRCEGSTDLGRFHGPGRRSDPCPIANVYALEALAHYPDLGDHPAVRAGMEMLLRHWERRAEDRFYLFGVGTDYRKLKYPFIWYDLLHVAEVLGHFTDACADWRYREMLDAILVQADARGRYTPGSMYRAWNGWSFADKKAPSPWLTCQVLLVLRRAGRWP
ncbi:MAG: hypothetical protein ACYC5M_15225 [Anaerolineae bacterium]